MAQVRQRPRFGFEARHGLAGRTRLWRAGPARSVRCNRVFKDSTIYFLIMRTLLSFVACAALTAAQTPAGSGLDPERLQAIHPRLQTLVDQGSIPGAVALVARHGKVALLEAAGWRDVENKKPMQTDSIFQIMSMTKNFTGVAVMMLVEDGKVELRRPIEDYLPEYHGIQVQEKQFNGPGAEHAPQHPPTVWQLMDHTSGLGGDPEGELADNPRTMRVPLADAVRFYARSHLQFEPGTRELQQPGHRHAGPPGGSNFR